MPRSEGSSRGALQTRAQRHFPGLVPRLAMLSEVPTRAARADRAEAGGPVTAGGRASAPSGRVARQHGRAALPPSSRPATAHGIAAAGSAIPPRALPPLLAIRIAASRLPPAPASPAPHVPVADSSGDALRMLGGRLPHEAN